MRRIIRFEILIVSLLSMFACSRGVVYENYKSTGSAGWHQDSVVVFTVPVEDTVSNFDLYFCVRHQVTYPYSNLWLFVDLQQPDGQSRVDTFEMTLADPTGKWLGKGLNKLKTREVLYKSHVFFPVSGTYEIRVRQGMRAEVLQGISDLGFRVQHVRK